MDYGGDWLRLDSNFDNIIQAMITMFKCSLTEGWIDIMNSGIDSNGFEKRIIRENKRYWAIFFMIFIVLGAFFILNIFDNIIIEKFKFTRD